jgi:hypothetical protein
VGRCHDVDVFDRGSGFLSKETRESNLKLRIFSAKQIKERLSFVRA